MLNEDSLWYGGATDRSPKHALRHLSRLRELVEDGRLAEAEGLVEMAFVANPESMRHYEPAGRVELDFSYAGGIRGDAGRGGDAVEGYRRWLDLERGMGGCEFEVGGVGFRREMFGSEPDQVVVCRLSAEVEGRLGFRLRLGRKGLGLDGNVYFDAVEVVEGCLVMSGRTGGRGVGFCVGAEVVVGGGMYLDCMV